jgi:hypothetical protein
MPSCNRHALVAGCFCHQLLSIVAAATAATAAGPPLPPLPPLWSNSPSSIAKERQQQQHHQLTNGSTNMKMFTSPDDLDLFNLSIQYLKCVMMVEGI